MMYYYLCAIFTLISAAVSFGFSIETYVQSRQQKNTALDTALNNSKYALSRSFSLFLVAIGLLIWISVPYLVAISVIMISVQVFDGIIGIKISTFKTVGPILTAIGNMVLLVLLVVNQ